VIKENAVKQLLKSGKPATGLWLAMPSLTGAEALATMGWDWLTLDVEHAPFNLETQQSLFLAIASQGCVPLARIAANDTTIIKQTLDAGAMGVVVPMVCTADEARAAVAACRYPPEGVRSAGGGRWSRAYGSDWQGRANDETLCIVMIEHVKGVENAEAILSVPGVDGCFIGPNDLSWSMGLKGRRDDAHEAALMRVRDAGRATGTPVGLHCGSPEEVVKRIEQGFQFLACQNDMAFMLAGATAAHRHIKGAAGG
jgi:4-hydroxy-2-oxoheptanedioate aldolase